MKNVLTNDPTPALLDRVMEVICSSDEAKPFLSWKRQESRKPRREQVALEGGRAGNDPHISWKTGRLNDTTAISGGYLVNSRLFR